MKIRAERILLNSNNPEKRPRFSGPFRVFPGMFWGIKKDFFLIANRFSAFSGQNAKSKRRGFL
jgi:hypothetical protein